MKPKQFARRLLGLLLVLLLLASCAYNPETVLAVDGDSVKSGVYLYYQLMVVMNELTAAIEDGTQSAKDILKDNPIVEGVAARQWVQNKTTDYCKMHVFIEREFNRLGLSFSSIILSSYQSSIQEEWANASSFLLNNGISYDSFEEVMLITNYKRQSVMEALYKYGGEKEITVEEYDNYFHTHYTKFDYLVLSLASMIDGMPLVEEFEERVVEIAEQLVERANARSLDRAFLEFYPDIAEIIGDESEIDNNYYLSMVRENIVTNDTSTSPSEDLVKQLFAGQEDDESDGPAPDNAYKLFYQEGNTLIIYRVVGLDDEDKYKDYETALRNAIAEEPFEKYIKLSIARYPMEIDERARGYYSVDKIRYS